MHFSTAVLTTIAALAPLASAVGNAVVVNNCKKPVHLWSVGGSVGPMQTLQHGENFTEQLYHDPSSGGIALKITRPANGLFTAAPQMDFAYTLDGNNVWYDLSDVFGDPFSGHMVAVNPSVTTCPSLCWPDGVSPSGSQVKVCQASSNITLTLCATQC